MIGLIRLCPKCGRYMTQIIRYSCGSPLVLYSCTSCGVSPEPRYTVDNKTEIIRKDASDGASMTKMHH